MSGLVVGYGQPERTTVEKMFEKIEHRGPDVSGIWEHQQVVMAQNYLKVDLAPGKESIEIPFTDSSSEDLRICYDGQLGNGNGLDGRETNGHLREDQWLLDLYQQHNTAMFEYLDDAIFAFVISDGEDFLAARDLLGIKTLFYGRQNGTVYLASELKSLVPVTSEVHEFPPGHYMDATGRLVPFTELPQTAPPVAHTDLDQIIEDVRDIIERSLRSRVDFAHPTAALLSGGMDSSVIAYLASELYKEKFGPEAKLKTFAMGVGESGDIRNARVMAAHINSDHRELIVELEQVLEALPEAIYYLESFDPSLVRSAVSNFLISKYANEAGIEILLSGEGGDEIFGGYLYLKDFPAKEFTARQIECLGFLHNNASLRLDRMNQSHSVRVVAPLISGELLDYALRLPPEYKMKSDGEEKIEKWIFRKAYENFLPESITWRLKQEFSQGSGSADLLPGHFEKVISDKELSQAQAEHPVVRSKEELYYFRIFTEHFGADYAVDTVGQWISL
jgi:asparagine synthase (glutamine-hydrolysing)